MQNALEQESYKKNTAEVILIILLGFCYLFPVFRSEIFLYSAFFDDFYYYLKIAENYCSGEGFSFTKGVYTNGYQPFYQYFICALVYLSKLFGVNTLVFIRTMLTLTFTGFSLLLLKTIKPRFVFSRVVFLCGLFSYYFISANGMESLFIIPVLALFMIKLSANSATIFEVALYSVLCFFVRIDSFVILIPVVLYHLLSNHLLTGRKFFKTIAAFIIASIPLIIYLLYNHFYFGTLFPISGIAKTVVGFSGFHAATFKFFITRTMPLNLIFILGVFLCLFFYFKPYRQRNRLLVVYLVGTALLYIQNSLRSDWNIWPWYFYPFPVSILFASKEANFNLKSVAKFYRYAFYAVVITLPLFILYLVTTTAPREPEVMNTAALKVNEFEKNNNGIYAMGDRAGIVGYLLESPLVQLEGLVMDTTYLNQLKTKKRVSDLLNDYKVDYYIVSNPKKINDSTYLVSEPSQSHGYSYKLQDTISWPVMMDFIQQSNYTFKKNIEVHTIIFKVPK